jgi:hypothetical protein
MDDLAVRLAAAGSVLARKRTLVEGGEPWPLSSAYGTEPESAWGPKEVLAHVAEMLGFWHGEIDRIVAAPAGPIPFGRVASDATRIARIGNDRTLPAGVLFERIAAGIDGVDNRLRQLEGDVAQRAGTHERFGEMTIPAIVERFLVGHLEEHAAQLDALLAARQGGDVAGGG